MEGIQDIEQLVMELQQEDGWLAILRAHKNHIYDRMHVDFSTASVKRLLYLVETPSGTVFASRGEVAQLDVQQVHQLAQSSHRVRDVSRVDAALGLL